MGWHSSYGKLKGDGSGAARYRGRVSKTALQKRKELAEAGEPVPEGKVRCGVCYKDVGIRNDGHIRSHISSTGITCAGAEVPEEDTVHDNH